MDSTLNTIMGSLSLEEGSKYDEESREKMAFDQKKMIEELLEFDMKTRENETLREEDFFPLSKIEGCNETEFRLPRTIPRCLSEYKLMTHEKCIMNNFYKKNKFLLNIDTEGMFFAGGFVSSLVLVAPRQEYRDMDIDIFVCGYNSIESAERRIEKFVQDYCFLGNEIYTVTRSEHAITIRGGKRGISYPPIQIILRLYSSPSEVLHGFDLGSCMVGIWNKNVYTTRLGGFSFANRCNVINLPRRSTTYERRLTKYDRRGFGIIFPDLDLDKSDYKRAMFISKIHLEKLPHQHNCLSVINYESQKDRRISDYSVTGSKYIRAVNFELIAGWNIEEPMPILIRKKYIYRTDSDTFRELFATDVTGIDERLIRQGYEYLKINRKLWIYGDKIDKFLPGTSLDLIYQKIKNEESLDELKQKHIESNIEKVKLILEKGTIPVKWITENPGTQLCGSFNPTVVSKKEWYGEYLKE